MEELTATILITTKNRKDELKRAVESAILQEDVCEILVFDDGSTDGTGQMIRELFPTVRLERVERSLGIVAARNAAVRLAKGSVVITIDDDCVFQSPHTVRDTLSDFNDPRIGAVAIPHINVRISPVIQSRSPRVGDTFVLSEFTGCASAVRRDLFLGMGGFNPVLWRQCEEYDFCTRLLSRGYFTRCGSAVPIAHYESPKRTPAQIVYHMARGRLLYTWCNVPFPAVACHAVATVAKSIFDAHEAGHLRSAVLGLANAASTIWSSQASRSPVRSRAYYAMRRLRKRGPMELSSAAAYIG